MGKMALKTVELLKSLDIEEMKAFRDFLASAYFNKNRRVLNLFDTLKKYYPGFESKSLTNEGLYRKLYPGKRFNEQIIKNLKYELLKLGKEFLAVQSYMSAKDIEKDFKVLSELSTKKLDSLFKKELKVLENKLNNNPVDELYFNSLMRLEMEKSSHILRRTLREWEITEHLEKSSECLIFYFIIKFSKVYLDHLMNVEKNFSEESTPADVFFKNVNFEKVLEYLKDNGSKYYPIISMYYYRILAFKHVENERYYRLLKKLFYENFKLLGRYEQFSVIYTLENVNVIRINKGIQTDTGELFGIYDFQVKNKLYNSMPQLPITAVKFRNIVVVAIGRNEIDWAEKFVKEHGHELLSEIREQIINICYSYIYFSRKEFERSLDVLKKVSSVSYLYKADVKLLTIQNFYELGYYEEVLSSIESYSKTLKTGKQMPDWHKKAMLNRITFIAELTKAKAADDRVLIGKLKEKFDKSPEHKKSKWIYMKMEELTANK